MEGPSGWIECHGKGLDECKAGMDGMAEESIERVVGRVECDGKGGG